MEALSAGGSGKRWRGRSTDAVTIKSGMVTAFEAVDAEGQESLERDLIDLIDRYNRSRDDDGTVGLPGSGGDQKTNHYDQRPTSGRQ